MNLRRFVWTNTLSLSLTVERVSQVPVCMGYLPVIKVARVGVQIGNV